MDGLELAAFRNFIAEKGWRCEVSKDLSLTVRRFARLCLLNGQIAHSPWQEKKRPDEQVDFNGDYWFAEVLYFFFVDKGDRHHTCAAIRMYSAPDADILKSYNTVKVCWFLGEDAAVHIVDVKVIDSVVGMIPFYWPGEE
ncbi:hypothetical protein V5O48_008351 [Marasmius crinis-equi]|uniref:Uncharacterized protein n=1 Tax=Marasmius crinis-equi TaxID=585013 RepID=A0ABR3FEA0_9AGAR